MKILIYRTQYQSCLAIDKLCSFASIEVVFEFDYEMY